MLQVSGTQKIVRNPKGSPIYYYRQIKLAELLFRILEDSRSDNSGFRKGTRSERILYF